MEAEQSALIPEQYVSMPPRDRTFSEKFTFAQATAFKVRKEESAKIMANHPGKVPIVLQKDDSVKEEGSDLTQSKFIIPGDFTYS